jgi:hypothetical protein
MSKKKNFTKEQKHLIRQCMLDADIMGLSKQETIDYVKSRVGVDNFSDSSYKKYRNEFLNDESNVQWISYYARKGFVEFYRKRIAEMEMIQKETFKQWHNEMDKPDSQQDKSLIIKLVVELRANNQQLTSLGMVTPIIATIKNIIDDKDKIVVDTSKLIHPNHHIKNLGSIEEDTDIDTTTTEGSKDLFSDSLSLDRSTNKEEDDPNRKF